MRRQVIAFVFVAVPLAAAFTSLGAEAPSAKAAAQSRPAVPAPRAIELDAVDKAADPCNDFYQYACGAWMAKNPVPADRRSWGRFQEVQERNFTILRRILETTTDTADPDRRKAAHYYGACMDESAIEAKGLMPIGGDLATIDALRNPDDLPVLLAYVHSIGVPALFRFGSQTDLRDATQMIADVDQGGLSLPDREYYLKTDARSVELRTKYAAHVEQMFRLAGQTEENAAQASKGVLSVETKLAEAALDRVKRRDPSLTQHPMPLVQLQTLAPTFDWKKYFEAAGAPKIQFLNVSVPDYLVSLNALITPEHVDEVKDYLRWQLLHTAAEMLPNKFSDGDFDYFRRTLEGQQTQEPR